MAHSLCSFFVPLLGLLDGATYKWGTRGLVRIKKEPKRYYSCILDKNQGPMPQVLAPLYGFPVNGAFALIAWALPLPPFLRGGGAPFVALERDMACRCTPLDCSRGAPRPSVSWIQPKRWAAKSVNAGRFDTFTFGTVVRVSGQRCLCAYSTVITPSPHFCGEGETCFASAPAPIQLPTVSSGQIRKRVRICRRCARVRMSAAGLSWTHSIRPFGGVRCFYAGGCGSLAGETARNRAADQIRQRCRICRFRPVSPWGKNLARMGLCGLATYGPKHSCPGGWGGRRPARARTHTCARPRL